jgi:hypothetical protein
MSFRVIQSISREAIDVMRNLMTDNSMESSACAFFDNLAASRPEAVQPFDDVFIAAMNAETNVSAQAAGVLVKLATDSVTSRYCFSVCRWHFPRLVHKPTGQFRFKILHVGGGSNVRISSCN